LKSLNADLTQLTEKVICDVKKIPCPDDKRVDVWTAITLQISSKDSCDWAYVSIIEEVINKYASKLKGNTLRTLWKETEAGMQYQDDEGAAEDIGLFSISGRSEDFLPHPELSLNLSETRDEFEPGITDGIPW